MTSKPSDGSIYCTTPGCGNLKPKQKRGFHNKCWKCQDRKKREKDPAAYTFNRIKQSAKRRGVPFHMTIGEWRWWCEQTDYLTLRGRNKESMSIGRINHRKGYSISNIRIEKYHFNSIKGHSVPGEDLPQNFKEDYSNGNEPF